MNKAEAISSLNETESDLKQLLGIVSKRRGTTISSSEVQSLTQLISRTWFENIDGNLVILGVEETTRGRYHELFDRLLKLSLRTSWKNTYQKTIQEILDNFKDDLVVPIMKSMEKVTTSQIAKMPSNVTAEEKEYLEEAIGCADHGFYRGSVVLGWSAAVHRLHRLVEKLGFDEFNKKSQEMKKITEGRFKRFNKSFSVHSLSELEATVFDNDLLWVLEYWNLIDANQHERLSICFTMRNNSAHPGEAPISPENLASFYSDLKKIVFDNPKFKL